MNKFLHTRAHGFHGENQVVTYLTNRGFVILARNYMQRYGEIDIVAQLNDLVVFVEVKMCTHEDVDPGELVPLSKQKKLILTAHHYIATHYFDSVSYRFDVACVMGNCPQAEILYLPDAFCE